MTDAVALLCTNHVATRYGERLAAAAPSLEVVQLIGDDEPDDANLARVDAALLSADSYPARTGLLLGVALRAPKLRWLHTFSAGIDHPVFGEFRDRGVRTRPRRAPPLPRSPAR